MEKAYVIAEAGVNHNGSMDMAFKLVDVAVESGADAVKFQTFKAGCIVTKSAKKAAYQNVNHPEGDNTQFSMLKKLELDKEQHEALIVYCKKRGIEFLSTPFDLDSLDLLAGLGLQKIKISSGDLTNAPLLLSAARRGISIILSTGMSTLGEIEDALGVIAYGYLTENRDPNFNDFKRAYWSKEGRSLLKNKVSILHCTTEYPAPIEDVNLKVIPMLRQAFGLTVGLSDHTQGFHVPLASIAVGATIIEKHFTLDKALPGPDHKASLDPEELTQMISYIRDVEQAMGNPFKYPTDSEMGNIDVVRKSIVASKPIAVGEIFTADKLTTKRPGHGISPLKFWDLIGQKASRNFQKDDLIE